MTEDVLDDPDLTQRLSELDSLFREITNDSIQALVSKAFQQIDSRFLELFDEKWLDNFQPIEEIFNRLNNSFEIFFKISRKQHTELYQQIERKALIKYLTSMMRRKVSYSKEEEREMASKKIREEANIFREFFQAVAVYEEEKDFDLESDLGILETISNIVRTDEEMITFELMTLVRKSQSQIIILQTK